LVGSYENELHVQLELLLAAGFKRIINVGAADGYYAVGAALRCPTATVYAFDIDPIAREWCQRTAALNGVTERIRIGGECSIDWMRSLDDETPTLFIVDCEGCELDVLQPTLAPVLRRATLLVELHEVKRPGVSEQIQARFRGTHASAVIDSRTRDPDSYPELAGFADGDVRAMLWERPYRMQWTVLRPRTEASEIDRAR
jgi:hypothetical protein